MRQRLVCILITFLVSLALPAVAAAQGALLVPDDEYAELVRRSSTTPRAIGATAVSCGTAPRPASVDLAANFPAAGAQGGVPSCTAWAVANAVSYFVSVARGGRTKEGRPEMHAPMHLYRRVHGAGVCERGTRIDEALAVVQREGIPPWDRDTASQDRCEAASPAAALEKASRRRIQAPRALGNDDPVHGIDARTELAAGHPVIVSFETTRAFGVMWGVGRYDLEASPQVCETTLPLLADGRPNCMHAMVVVGYDDARRAYRVLNSWGDHWGENGLAWISYDAWRTHAKQAFAVTGLQNPDAVQCLGGSEWSIDRQTCECPTGRPAWDRFERACILPPRTCPRDTTWSSRARGCMCRDEAQWWVDAHGRCEAVTCPDNFRWNPETHRCTCPEGTTWDETTRHCVRASCPEGETLSPDRTECRCPTGRHRDAAGRCVAVVCEAGRVLNSVSGACACLDGAAWDATRNVCRPPTVRAAVPRVTLRLSHDGTEQTTPVAGEGLVGRAWDLPGFYGPVPAAVVVVPEGASVLSVHVRASPGDATLLLEAPDGSLRANDDAGLAPHPQDPQILVRAPSAGHWRVWVGSWIASQSFSGTLHARLVVTP